VSRGRLSPAEMFPAGDTRFRTHNVQLPSGMRLRTVECGDPHAADIVVSLHGWGCSIYTFRDLLPLLASAGLRAIAIDLPGHGLSDKPEMQEAYTADALTDCIVAALDALSITRATFVGHSMGGAIAARVAVRYPSRIERLVLCAPVGFGAIWPLKLAVLCTPPPFASVLPYLVPRWIVPFVLWIVYGGMRTPTRRDYTEYWSPTQFPPFVRALRLLLHRFDWQLGEHGALNGITAPTTVIYGGKDHLVSGRSAQKYATAIPGTRLICLPESGHVIPEEAPAQVAAAIIHPYAPLDEYYI
jgi:pimeloyl-ACP methyl ester carboxylesterase